MTKDLIQKFKAVLLKRKEQIVSHISKFAQKNQEGEYEVIHEEYGNSDEENSDEIEDGMQNESLLSALNSELKNIDKAVERIETNSYGKCEVCGNPIEEKRLEFNPEATLCSSCQMKKEKDLI